MTVYLLHFKEPYKHARHYLGSVATGNVQRRLALHRAGRGARLTQVVRDAGIDFVLARTWPGSRPEERRLKNRHGSNRLCPICKLMPKQMKLFDNNTKGK